MKKSTVLLSLVFLATGVVYTSSAVNSLIYAPSGAKEASAAGFILLSIVSIAWIMYYGCQPGSGVRAKLDSFALHRGAKAYRTPRPRTSSFGGNKAVPTGPQMYTSAQLGNNFETSTPVTGYQGGPISGSNLNTNSRNSAARFGTGAGTLGSAPLPQESSSGEQAVADYPYRAKAIYSYEANPDDANEISFSKHEILEVSDVSGRWWQAKKENGETGIAPSNYLILL